MTQFRVFLSGMGIVLFFVGAAALPVQAWQNQILKKLDDQSFAALAKGRGPYLDLRVDDAAQLTDMVKLYTGRFGDPQFSLEKYEVNRVNAKRALIPYFQLSPRFRRAYVGVMWPGSQLKGNRLRHRVLYPGHETLWSISQIFTGTGTHWERIKRASGLKSDGVYKGLVVIVPKEILFSEMRGEMVDGMPQPDEPQLPALPEPGVAASSTNTPAASANTPAASANTPASSTNTPAREIETATEDTDAGPVFHEPTPVAQPEELPSFEAVVQGRNPESTVATQPDEIVESGQDTEPSSSSGDLENQDEPVVEQQDFVEANEPAAPEQAADDNEAGAAEAQKPNAEAQQRILKHLADLDQVRGLLTWGSDRKGRYAQYRLKAGEAIYSSVVVRFCGLTRAADVNRVARTIIERNNIRDETDLAIGTPIRIPYELLEPEYLAQDDPVFQAYLENLAEVSLMATEVVSRNLEGVYVILDAGHGGRDPGAMPRGIWEDDYVYDILCRVKAKLEQETGAVVIPTILDPSVNYKVQDVSKFRRDNDEVLLTQPRYPLTAKNMVVDGVHLRWLIANHHYDRLVKQGVKPENILFASFHAESLHRSIRGSMFYVPDARLGPKRSPASRYQRYAEYRGNQFSFTKKQLRQAQALSTSFAMNLKAAKKEAGIRVYHQKPIRSAIYRNPRKPFVPAVIRYNRVPTRVLIEVCNLNNQHDRANMKNAKFRQKVAESFVQALQRTYQPNSGGSNRASLRGL